MPDNLKLPGPEDRNYINIGQAYEVSYWVTTLRILGASEGFSVSEEKLIRAVSAVGTRVVDVKKWLRENI